MKTARAIDLQSDRNEAFSELDIDKIKAYYASQGMPPTSSDKALLAEVHKVRLNMASIDAEEKASSRQWLVENGFTPDVSSPPVGNAKSGILQGIFGKRK